MAKAKTAGRRGVPGPRPGRSRGSAALADGPPAAAPDPSSDYAEFVRQRKDELAREVREQRERSLQIADGIADARLRRAFLHAEAQHERDIADFWRRFFRRVRRQRDGIARSTDGAASPGVRRSSARARGSRRSSGLMAPPSGAIQLAAYSGPVLDRKGRRGIYLSASYLSSKTATYGCARRLVRYVTDPEHVERLDGTALCGSNVGETRSEMSAAFGLVEDLNRAARANAKVVFHLIVQLPFDVTPAERAAIMERWCEDQFGSRNLPYVWAVHAPDAEGDQRNTHGHVAVSFRPLVRVAPNCWEAGRELKAELDNPEQFRIMREQFARVMTEVAEEAGKNHAYTALSYAARGMKIKATEHLGTHKTRLVRTGQYVAADARNRAKIRRNEAMLKIEQLKRRRSAMERRLARVRRIEARAVRPVYTVRRVSSAATARPTRVATTGRVMRKQQVVTQPIVGKRAPAAHGPAAVPVAVGRPVKADTIGITAVCSAARDIDVTAVRAQAIIAAARPVRDDIPRQPTVVSLGRPAAPAPSAQRSIVLTQTQDAHRPVASPVSRSAIPQPSRPKAAAPPSIIVRTMRSARPQRAESGNETVATMSAREEAPPPMPAFTAYAPKRADRPFDLEPAPAGATPMLRRSAVAPRPQARMASASASDRPPAIPIGIDDDLLRAAFGDHGRRRRARAKAGAPLMALAAAARIDWAGPQLDGDATLDRLETLDQIEPLTLAPMTAVTARIRKADLYVLDDGTGRLVLDPRVMTALTANDAALDTPAEQWALADLRRGQQRVISDLVSEAERRPLAFGKTGPKPWPRDLDPATLARLERWSKDEGFRHDLFFKVELPVAEAHRAEEARTRTTRVAAQRTPGAAVAVQMQMPDGFGGTRRAPPPSHVPVAAPGVSLAAYDGRTGAPSRQLLLLARFAGEQPALIDRAADGRLTTLPATPALAAALVDLWRQDTAVDTLITRIVTDSRAAGRPTWPADIAAALRREDQIGPLPPPLDRSQGPPR